MFFEMIPQYTALPRRKSSYHPYDRQHSYTPVAMRLPVGDSWLDFDDEPMPFSNFLHWPMATRRCMKNGRKLQRHKEKTSLEKDDRAKDSVRQKRQENGSQNEREVVTSHTEEQEKEEQVVECDGEQRLVEIDAAGVEPSDIQVKTNSAKGVITVTVTRHHMTLFGPITSMSTRVMPFPEGVKADDIRSYMTPDDKLVITLKKNDKEEAKEGAEMDEEPDTSGDEVTTQEDESQKTEVTNTDSFEVFDSESRDAEAEVASDKMEDVDGAFARVDMRGFDAADISVRVSEDGHNVEVVGERQERTEHSCSLHRVFRSLPLPQQQQQQQDGDIEHRVDSKGVVHLIARKKQESIEQ